MSENEAKAVAIAALPTLFSAWGGEDSNKRSSAVDHQLARLALLAKDADVLAVVAAHAVRWLHWSQYRSKDADALRAYSYCVESAPVIRQ